MRFIALPHGVRACKDAMSRDIPGELDKVRIGMASSTYDIVGLPPVEIRPAGASVDPGGRRFEAVRNRERNK